MPRKILIFTGSRGEWGYLRPILEELERVDVEYNLVVSNMHLDEKYGDTGKEIEKDGFKIDDKILMNISGDKDLEWSKSLGLLLFQAPDIIKKYKPNIVLLAGDRAETFIFCTACFYMDIPVAHIQAGELSGHKDGMARHALGKFANIHFASNLDAYERLLRLGESKFRIFMTGAPQLDDIINIKYLESKLKAVLNKLRVSEKEFCLCIFHPTSDDKLITEKIKEVNIFLKSKSIHQIWILPNSDGGATNVLDTILNLERQNVSFSANLSREEFLHLLYYSKFLIGNSSAGILEAPCLGTPSINIGTRQTGRIQAKSVIQIDKPNSISLNKALNDVLKIERRNYSLYGDGKSAEKIVEVLKNISIDEKLLNKFLDE